jgi:hypothetical protein
MFNFLFSLNLASQISIGASTGVTFSKLNEGFYLSGVQNHQLIGFEIGLNAQYKLTNWLFIQSELGYIQKSGKVRGTMENRVKIKNDIGFVNIVPCININRGKFIYYVGVGLYANYLVNNPFSKIIDKKPSWLPSDAFFEETYDKFNLGINYTGGIRYLASGYSIFLQLEFIDLDAFQANIDIIGVNNQIEPLRFTTYREERIVSIKVGLTVPFFLPKKLN